jgi:hypothetical protein
MIAVGLCLAVNVIPGAWLLLLQLSFALPGYHPQLVSEGYFATMGGFLLDFALGACGMIGLRLVYEGVGTATDRIRADKDGLATSSGQRQRLMLWSRVQDISWGPGVRGQYAYLVTSDLPNLQMSWPAGPQVASAGPPGDGAVPIGADELAALAAARIGKPIRVRA